MTPSPDLIFQRRQALIDLAGIAGFAGRLRLLDASAGVLVTIDLAYPCGVVDATGVALYQTNYSQVLATGDVASARLESGAGAWVGDFTVGLATDVPAPELPMPALRLYAGSFVRLNGAHVACD